MLFVFRTESLNTEIEAQPLIYFIINISPHPAMVHRVTPQQRKGTRIIDILSPQILIIYLMKLNSGSPLLGHKMVFLRYHLRPKQVANKCDYLSTVIAVSRRR